MTEDRQDAQLQQQKQKEKHTIRTTKQRQQAGCTGMAVAAETAAPAAKTQDEANIAGSDKETKEKET